MTSFSGLDFRLLVVLVIVILAGTRAWQNRERRGSKSLTAFLAVLGILVSAHLFAHLTAGQFELLFIKLRWTGLFALPFFVLAFAVVFTRQEALFNREGLAALFAIPLFIALFLWAPTVLDLFGIDIGTAAVTTFLNEEGLVYLVSVAAAYLALIAASLLILYHSYLVHDRFRRQAWVLVGGILILWLGTAIEVFGLFNDFHLHWVQNSFLLFGLAVLWVVYRGDVTDIRPLARTRIIETIEVAILVIDDRGKITDINPAAEELLAIGEAQVVGTPISAALSELDPLLEAIDGDVDEVIELPPTAGGRVVSPSVTPLHDLNGDRIGRVLLLYDVTEQHRQREELHRQNERLDEFAKVVSHDLRNPLSVAIGRLDLATSEYESEHLDLVDDSLEHMATMIDELYDLATAGEDVGTLVPVDLSDIVEATWQQVDTRSAELVNQAERVVLADETRLRQLLANLIQNAIAHGGAEITVHVGELPGGFYLEDDGPGIPEENRSDVLEPGYTTSDDGTGFGLSIVRDVAHGHGWDVHVTEGADNGARFEFTDVEFE